MLHPELWLLHFIEPKTDRSKQGGYIASLCRISEMVKRLMVSLGIATTQRGYTLLADLKFPVDGIKRAGVPGIRATMGAGAAV
jgi:hypothetical protein